jgi:magnesium transporter
MDVLAEDIEDMEMRMFADHQDGDTLQEIFRLKRGLLDLRRVIAPTRDVFNVFVRRELPFFGEESVFYFQDVYDHIIRITDTIDADRDVLSSAIDVHLSLASNRMNQTVRTLTVASIILMSVTLVAGIYGMNFVNIPELRWHYGYFIALLAMLAIGGGELAFFRRINWW